MQVSLEWQALEQNKGFFRRTTTWILFRMCTKEETALNILQERKNAQRKVLRYRFNRCIQGRFMYLILCPLKSIAAYGFVVFLNV
jgi:GTP-dependent phosphoenolpyruvate carboxykinase